MNAEQFLFVSFLRLNSGAGTYSDTSIKESKTDNVVLFYFQSPEFQEAIEEIDGFCSKKFSKKMSF